MSCASDTAGPAPDAPPASRLLLFQARLAGRDSLPAERLDYFAGLPLDEVRAAALNTAHVARRIRADLRHGLARGQSVCAVLAGLDLELFSCDHDWRDIFRGLARQGAEHDELHRTALEAYLRYLDSRHEQLQALARAGRGTRRPGLRGPAPRHLHGQALRA